MAYKISTVKHKIDALARRARLDLHNAEVDAEHGGWEEVEAARARVLAIEECQALIEKVKEN